MGGAGTGLEEVVLTTISTCIVIGGMERNSGGGPWSTISRCLDSSSLKDLFLIHFAWTQFQRNLAFFSE